MAVEHIEARHKVIKGLGVIFRPVVGIQYPGNKKGIRINKIQNNSPFPVAHRQSRPKFVHTVNYLNIPQSISDEEGL